MTQPPHSGLYRQPARGLHKVPSHTLELVQEWGQDFSKGGGLGERDILGLPQWVFRNLACAQLPPPGLGLVCRTSGLGAI